MSVEQLVLAHYRRRRQLIDTLAAAAKTQWGRIDPFNIARTWTVQLVDLMALMTAAQVAAARAADAYVAEALDAQGINPAADGELAPRSLGGVASDGRPLASLLYEPVIGVLSAIGAGVEPDRALAGGYAVLEMMVRTQVADAGRVADQTALVARRRAGGYVRMVVGRTCGRCVVLAGRWYRWNTGFDRHPHCDCVHVPAAEDDPADISTNPRAWFDNLSTAEQDRQFTKAGAQAIRDGADIGQVVNARRGAFGLAPAGARLTRAEVQALRGGRERGALQTRDVFGQQLFTTSEGVTTRGLAGARLGARTTGEKAGGRYRQAKAPRLMPESIYQIAGNDRDEAIRLLRRFGYIT